MKVQTFLHPGNWAQGSQAFDKGRHPVPPTYEGAVSFCLLGAISLIATKNAEACVELDEQQKFKFRRELRREMEQKLEKAIKELHGESQQHVTAFGRITHFNDTEGRTFAEVEKVLKLADI